MLETLGIHYPSLLIYLANFLLVLVLLRLFAYKPILRLMDQRADRIRESLEASERRARRGLHLPGSCRGATGRGSPRGAAYR